MHAQFLCSLLMFLRIRCLIPKVFINQSYFFETTMLPIIIPTISPNPYPTKTIFQPNSKRDPTESRLWLEIEGEVGEESETQHIFDHGFPHKPRFLTNELFSNVWNCFPCGIELVRLLWETLNHSRKVSCAKCGGIYPESLFWERSNDSSIVRFPKDGGMCPVRMLLERFSIWSPFKSPMDSGISPTNILLEISMALKNSWSLMYTVSRPLFVILNENIISISKTCVPTLQDVSSLLYISGQ